MNTVCIEANDNQKVLHMMQLLLIRTEYILQTHQEQQYADFLKDLQYDNSFIEFQQVIDEDISAFGITDQEIEETIQLMLITL
ncbi:hypothetical protein ABET51_06615 [Metabacillus fastidiosus]|uniref:hypothetical protein n=1 Tax=Metabacillus fastidiosus TaxID=1458 RepID=UPI003D292283